MMGSLSWMRVSLVTGVIFTLAGGLSIFFWPSIFSDLIEKNVALSEGSASAQLWMEAPMKLTMLYHFFNLTNPEDITNPKKKLIFVEMGPYAFTKRIEKENVTWFAENSTVTFTQRDYYYFDPELSRGSLDDNITSLSVPAIMAAHMSQNWGFFSRKALSLAIGKWSTITSTRSARELLFDGHDEPLFSLADAFPSDESVPEKFGWFFEFNGTNNEDSFTMGTGEKDIGNIGRLWRYNGEEETGFFEGECGLVRGSAGHMWAPKIKKTNITMFIESICRSVTLPFSGETSVRGIPAYKFTGDLRTMDNGTLDPSSSCYCGAGGDECLPIGGLNVSICHKNTPMVISYPHFYLADPWYTQNVSGMEPDPEKHSFYMTLEPTAGYPIDVRARTQLSIYLKPSKHISLLSNVREVVFPVMWTEGRAVMTDKLLGLTQTMIAGESWGMMGCASILGIGVILILISGILYYLASRRKNDRIKVPSGIEEYPWSSAPADPLMEANPRSGTLEMKASGFSHANGGST